MKYDLNELFCQLFLFLFSRHFSPVLKLTFTDENFSGHLSPVLKFTFTGANAKASRWNMTTLRTAHSWQILHQDLNLCFFSHNFFCVIIFQLWIGKVKVVWNLNIQEFGGTVDTLGGESILPPHVISLSCGILHNICTIFYWNNMCELLISKNSKKLLTLSWRFIFSPYVMKWHLTDDSFNNMSEQTFFIISEREKNLRKCWKQNQTNAYQMCLRNAYQIPCCKMI